LEPELERPQWPYAAGTFGGALVALGAFLVVLQLGSRDPGSSASLWMLGIGSALLGVAWVGSFRFGHIGAGGVCGSFLLPLVFLYLRYSHDEWMSARIYGLLLVMAFACFAAGTIFVRGLGWARSCAAIATLGFVIMFVGDAMRWQLDAGTIKSLIVLSFGSLSATGIALAIGFPILYSKRRDDQAL
jgi:hypothetical protein